MTKLKPRQRLDLRAAMKETQDISMALYDWFRSQEIRPNVAALAMMHMLAAYALVQNKKDPKEHVKRMSKLMNVLALEMKKRR